MAFGENEGSRAGPVLEQNSAGRAPQPAAGTGQGGVGNNSRENGSINLQGILRNLRREGFPQSEERG